MPPRLISSRPDILIDGQRETALAAGLTSLLIEETSAGLYRCEAVFSNWGPTSGGSSGFLYFDRTLLEFGKPFAVQLGGESLFSGRIGALVAERLRGFGVSLRDAPISNQHV